MNRGGSPGRTVLASDSAKVQEEIFKRIASDKEKQTTAKVERLSPEDLLKRRLESGRNPLSGISEVIPSLSDDPKLLPNPDDLLPDKSDPNEILLSSQRINARILEAWINNTIIDAEHLEIPAALARGEQQHPLSRFGIDRHSLARAGVSNNDINRIYKALFVYSLGFYQLVNKTMEHIDGKYTYIAGVWKIYSILLEYCCKVDYEMAISTVQEEMRVALEKCEIMFKIQLEQLQEKCDKAQVELEMNMHKLGFLEHELQLEKHKREDMEEEIAHRGTGQEEEVELRIKFESKLNQMFAIQRDMESRQKQHLKSIESLEKIVEEKTALVKDLSSKVSSLTEAKIALEGQVTGLEERLTHSVRMNNTLENRISDNMNKIEGLKEDYTETKEKLQLTQSQLLQSNLIIDKLESEKAAIDSQLLKVQAVVEGYQRERDQALGRVVALETALKTDISRFLVMEQEYVRIKADESAKDKLIANFRSISERVTDELLRTVSQLDSLKVQYDHQTVLSDQLKDQLKKAVNTIDEVTRGRKFAEDRIDELTARLEETNQNKDEIFLEYSNSKKEVEKGKTQIVELEQEIDHLEMKRRTGERQSEAQKEMLMQKIKNLSDILNSERKVRENWIEKFENEQRANSDSMKEAMEFRRGMSDLQSQLNSANHKREEAIRRLEAERTGALEARKLTIDLKHKLEESERKSLTLTRLIESLESDWNAKLNRAETRFQAELSNVHSIIFIEKMVAEDSYSRAFEYFSKVSALQSEIGRLETALNRAFMRIEDLSAALIAAILTVMRLLRRKRAK